MRTVFWNGAEARPRAAWRLLVQLALNLGLIVLLTWPLGVQSDSAVIARRPGLSVVLSFLRLVATLASVWLVSRFVDRRPMADYGLHLSAAWWADLGFGLGLGALLVSGGSLLGLALGWLTVTDTFRPGAEGASFAVAILIPVGQYLFVGVYEELLSRGYQLRNLAEGLCSDRLGPKAALWLALLSSSVFFALLHAIDGEATLLSLLSVLLAGLALGLGTLLTGELAIPMGYHIAFNLFADNVFGLGGQPGTPTVLVVARTDHLAVAGSGGPGGGLAGIAGSLLAMLLIVAWVRWRRGSLRLHTELATPTLLRRRSGG